MKLLHIAVLSLSALSGVALAAAPKPLPPTGGYFYNSSSGPTPVASCLDVVSDNSLRTITINGQVCRIEVKGSDSSSPKEGTVFNCLNPAGGTEGYFGHFSKGKITLEGMTMYTLESGVTKRAKDVYFAKDEMIIANYAPGSPCI